MVYIITSRGNNMYNISQISGVEMDVISSYGTVYNLNILDSLLREGI